MCNFMCQLDESEKCTIEALTNPQRRCSQNGLRMNCFKFDVTFLVVFFFFTMDLFESEIKFEFNGIVKLNSTVDTDIQFLQDDIY